MVRFVRDKANSTVVGFLFGDDEEENKEESTNIGADGGNPHQRYHYKQISVSHGTIRLIMKANADDCQRRKTPNATMVLVSLSSP